MWYAEDLIEYFSTLRRGYDRGIFSERVKDLGALVDSNPLSPGEFDKLFRVWLKLEIPISKWTTIGSCLVPVEPVQQTLLHYIARWLLANMNGEVSVPRLGFVLSWLTVALDNNLINTDDLDKYYVIFHRIFQNDRYASHAAKLLYTLTKPTDVTRTWTQLLLSLMIRRSSAREKAQIGVLLSLYKSYRPECVPESVPAVSTYHAFPKVSPNLLRRFASVRALLSAVDSTCNLKWRTDLSEKGVFGRGYKVRRLVPDMEFINVGSELYRETTSKNFLHFKDGVKVLAYSLRVAVPRPAQLLSMLCNETGVVLLAVMPAEQHAFLSHDLLHQLEACFLRPDQHTYVEKADLLRRISLLQQSLLQAIPVVSRFLVDYLPTWNGIEYSQELLSLLEWVHTDSVTDLRSCVLQPLRVLHNTLPPLERIVLLRTLCIMYKNMAYSRTRNRQYFLNGAPRDDHEAMLTEIRECVQELCLTSLRRYPGNSIVLDSVLMAHEALVRAELTHSVPACTALPPAVALAALTTRSAYTLNCLASTILLERKAFAKLRRCIGNDTSEHAKLLISYRKDIQNCLLRGKALTDRCDGAVLKCIPNDRALELLHTFRDADKAFTLERHLALAPYTYIRLDAVVARKVTNEAWLEHLVKPQFQSLAVLLEMVGRKTDA